MEKLKPCPFCGQLPELFKYTLPMSKVERVYFACSNMDCGMVVETSGCSTEEEAAAEWNKRGNNG